MGANLVPVVRNFYLETKEFFASDADVQDHCVDPGWHRLLRFDSLTHNIGDADLDIGTPLSRPDLFEWDPGHGHWHLIQFTEYRLFDDTGNEVATGVKLGRCLSDNEHRSDWGPQFGHFSTDCIADDSQPGVTQGWADFYHGFLPCQFIVIDGLPDGCYTLVTTTNAQHALVEDTYDDNTACVGLRLIAGSVFEIPPPIYHFLQSDTIDFGAVSPAVTVTQSAKFEVRTCRSVTFQVSAGPFPAPADASLTPVFTVADGYDVSLNAASSLDTRYAELPFAYTGGTPGDIATGSTSIRCIETGMEWGIISLAATTT